ncbi:potassium channel family protein [Longibacter salinarum]|uniref:potassium channel family protein n=1 Tax=Longibacter salinarum TaxID=1850348 RepID=UPI001C54FAAC|nr:potassium channel family protein [Longibacter salinarum]
MSISVLAILLVIAASLMFYAEHEAQPDVFSSIPATMWWAVATLTTVGYGDVYPVTVVGKILASIVAILGIGLFALPAGILASGLQEEWSDMTRSEQRTTSTALSSSQHGENRSSSRNDVCPHCGLPLDQSVAEG